MRTPTTKEDALIPFELLSSDNSIKNWKLRASKDKHIDRKSFEFFKLPLPKLRFNQSVATKLPDIQQIKKFQAENHRTIERIFSKQREASKTFQVYRPKSDWLAYPNLEWLFLEEKWKSCDIFPKLAYRIQMGKDGKNGLHINLKKLAEISELTPQLKEKWQEAIDCRFDLNYSAKIACPYCGLSNSVLLEEGKSKKVISYKYKHLPCPLCKYHCHLCHKEVYTIHDSGTYPEEYYTFEYEGISYEESTKVSLKQIKYWEGVFNKKYQRLREHFKKENLSFYITTNLKSNEKVIKDCKKRIKFWLNKYPELKEQFYDKRANVVRRGTDHCQVCGNLIKASKYAWNKRYCSVECGLIAQHNKFVEQRRKDKRLLEGSKVENMKHGV
jgi:predicted nucleic acid-binding Zn ribbon protein